MDVYRHRKRENRVKTNGISANSASAQLWSPEKRIHRETSAPKMIFIYNFVNKTEIADRSENERKRNIVGKRSVLKRIFRIKKDAAAFFSAYLGAKKQIPFRAEKNSAVSCRKRR